MFWRHWLICFAFCAVDLAVLAVIILFHEVSKQKLRQVVGNMESGARRPVSCTDEGSDL